MSGRSTGFGDRLYFDANIYVYALEDYPEYAAAVRGLFASIQQSGAIIIA